MIRRLADRHPYLLLITAALLPRFAWLLYTQPVPVSDFEQYRNLAASLIDHGQYGFPRPTAFRFPGFPVFLVPLMLINRSHFWLSLGTLSLSAVTVSLVYVFALHATRGNRAIAFIGAMAYAAFPPFIYLAPVLASENLLAVCLLAAAVVAVRADMSRWTRPVATGVLTAAAVLTRGEALFYLPVLAAAAGFRSGSRRAGLKTAGLVCGAAAVCLAPWYIRNARVIGPGAGLSTNGGYTFFLAHQPGGGQGSARLPKELRAQISNELELHRVGMREGLKALAARPTRLVTDTARATIGLYSPPPRSTAWSIRLPRVDATARWPTRDVRGIRWFDGLGYIAYVALGLLALISLRWLSSLTIEARIVTIGFIAANWVCYGVVFFGWDRYRYVGELFFCVLAGVSLVHVMATRRTERMHWSQPTAAGKLS